MFFHEPYIEITRKYFLQVAQTPGVPWYHHRYLATDHPQLISDTFTIMYTNNIVWRHKVTIDTK